MHIATRIIIAFLIVICWYTKDILCDYDDYDSSANIDETSDSIQEEFYLKSRKLLMDAHPTLFVTQDPEYRHRLDCLEVLIPDNTNYRNLCVCYDYSGCLKETECRNTFPVAIELGEFTLSSDEKSLKLSIKIIDENGMIPCKDNDGMTIITMVDSVIKREYDALRHLKNPHTDGYAITNGLIFDGRFECKDHFSIKMAIKFDKKNKAITNIYHTTINMIGKHQQNISLLNAQTSKYIKCREQANYTCAC